MSDLMKLTRNQWDRAAAAALVAAGLVALLLGWVGISGADAVVKQLPYMISGGIGGIALVGVGAALWVASDMRDEWSELRRLRLTVDRLETERVALAQVEVLTHEESGARHGRTQAAHNAVPVASHAGRENSSSAW
ncbi:hypothetical protein GCM10009547_35420 [Sporichthya brevicatena]|uniref:Lipopolysaccharide assembly protein A domain-containing protein n=1 Tax=Sporichthya brevicatena TaxID=171442 RepID=A0ABP3S824_9ACTN